MLSKSAQAIQDTLAESGFELKVMELSESTRTAAEAAATIGCAVAQIIKSLLFKTKESNKPILVLASGVNRVNEQIITAQVSEAIIKADANFTREATGFAIGGIPPIGHKQEIQTFIDQDLFQFDELWAAAGTPNAVFRLSSNDLKALSKGKVIAIQ